MRIDAAVATPAPPPASPATAPGRGFAEILERARDAWVASEREQRQLAAVTERAGPFSPAELLRLQVTMYRHVERIELAAHVADRCNGAVKTVLQTQV